MNQDGFSKFFWGFLFVLFDFRIQGFDVLPDIVGYIFFAIGIGILIENSVYFNKAKMLNLPLIFLSLFQLYERPMNHHGYVNVGYMGGFGVVVGIATFIISLLFMYNIFLGIKDMAQEHDIDEIYCEAEKKWKQILYLHIALVATFFVIFLPGLNIIYLLGLVIASIVIGISVLKFMKTCEQSF